MHWSVAFMIRSVHRREVKVFVRQAFIQDDFRSEVKKLENNRFFLILSDIKDIVSFDNFYGGN